MTRPLKTIRHSDKERLSALFEGLVFWRTKYNRGWGAHFSAKHGVGSGTYFSHCPREAIDQALDQKPIKHCACCNTNLTKKISLDKPGRRKR